MDKSTDALTGAGANGYGTIDDPEGKGGSSGKPREVWGRKIEFLLSCVGYAVGLGNVWRFPYLAYRNGGGAFLVPYTIMLLITGLPLFFMELAFGQFASLGPITMWRAVPLFKGRRRIDDCFSFYLVVHQQRNSYKDILHLLISCIAELMYNPRKPAAISAFLHVYYITLVNLAASVLSLGFAFKDVYYLGVGWAMMVVSFLVGLYYNVIIAWTLYYFFASMTSQLPWELCGQWWNTALCATVRGGSTDKNVLLHMFNDGVHPVTGLNSSYLDQTWISGLGSISNSTETMFATYNVSCAAVEVNNVTCNLTKYPAHYLWHFGIKLVSPAEEYWDNRVLRRSAGVEETGEILWDLALCLLLAWIVICGCLIKGVKSLGKVVYFTATFPYVVLTILLIRGCLLEGAIDGIKFYIIPRFEKLNNAAVWKDAATQIFYSLSVGFGGLPVMASYNKFNNNCLGDAIIVTMINCGTSVFAGFAIFSMVGFLAHSTGVPVQDAATSGPGLAFVAYPEGITQMPIAPLWALLFFLMLFTLGLDSQFAFIETITSGIADEFPGMVSGRWKLFGRVTITRKMLLTVFLCVTMFLLGLPMTTRGGVYWFQMLDYYSASHSILMIVAFEVVGLAYVYGINNFLADIELMIGTRPKSRWAYFLVCWTVLSPLSVVFIFIFATIDYTPVTYDGLAYPAWAETVGWLMASASMIMIPLFAVVVYCQKSKAYVYLLDSIKPEWPKWGPALEEDRVGTKYDTATSADGKIDNTVM